MSTGAPHITLWNPNDVLHVVVRQDPTNGRLIVRPGDHENEIPTTTLPPEQAAALAYYNMKRMYGWERVKTTKFDGILTDDEQVMLQWDVMAIIFKMQSENLYEGNTEQATRWEEESIERTAARANPAQLHALQNEQEQRRVVELMEAVVGDSQDSGRFHLGARVCAVVCGLFGLDMQSEDDKEKRVAIFHALRWALCPLNLDLVDEMLNGDEDESGQWWDAWVHRGGPRLPERFRSAGSNGGDSMVMVIR